MCPEFPKRRPDARSAHIAARQFGVISREQALQCGMTPEMVRYRLKRGLWEIVLPSVYRITGAHTSELQRLMAACLWGGLGTVAFGRSAGAAWDFHGGRWHPAEIATLRWMKSPGPHVIVHRVRTLEPCDLIVLGELPVTTATRTLIDMSARVDEKTLEIALDQAVRRRLLSLQSLRRRIDELAPRRMPGAGALRDLIDAREPGVSRAESPLETLVFRLLRQYGFPIPVFQYWMTLPDYGPARLDFAYPDLLVGIEADSYGWHSSRAAFERDRARISELASLGWIIIQTTHREIETRPERFANRLSRARASRLGNQG